MIEWSSAGRVTEIEETLQQLESLRSHVSSLGREIKPSSRIATFEQCFKRFLDTRYHPRRDPNFDPAVLSHGARDLFELNFICDNLARAHPDQLHKDLPDLLSGAVVPGADDNQKPRNLQFQYFLAAQLAHSGYSVTLKEPDAVFVQAGAPLGVAAKRPGSARKVVRNVRDGAKQLATEGLRGFVAVSLDLLPPRPHPYVVASGNPALDNAAQTLLQKAFKPHALAVHRKISGTTISGLIISLSVVGCVRVPWQPAHTTGTLWLPRADDLPQEEGLVRDVLSGFKSPGVG